MTRKVSNFSDLIQRVTASCLLHPLADGRYDDADREDKYQYEAEANRDDEDDEDEDEDEDDDCPEEKIVGFKILGEWKMKKKMKEMEALIEEVFESVSAMKKAYVNLQEAHCPWDQEKMRLADVAVVAELRKLGVLKERFRRSVHGKGRRRRGNAGAASLREVLAPYEAVVEELKKEVKAKDLEVQNLKERLESAITLSGNGNGKRVGRSLSRRKLSCSQIQGKPNKPFDNFSSF